MLRGRRLVAGALLLSMAAGVPAASAQTRDTEVRQGEGEQVPLEVTIRPRYEELKDGEVTDAIIRTPDGRYYLLSGYYVGDLPGRVRGARYGAYGLPGVDGLTLALARELSPQSAEVALLRRYGLDRDAVSLQLGSRFKGFSFVDLADLYGVDPFPQPEGFAAGKGMYGSAPFNRGSNLANQVLGSINLIDQGPDSTGRNSLDGEDLARVRLRELFAGQGAAYPAAPRPDDEGG